MSGTSNEIFLWEEYPFLFEKGVENLLEKILQAFGGNSEIDPLNPLSIFGLNMKSYKPWYEGENVCVESKIFEENIGGEEETSGETEAETGSTCVH